MNQIRMEVGKPIMASEISRKKLTGSVGRTIEISQDYNDLQNKPSINEVELVGEVSLADLGLISAEDIAETYATKTDLSGKQDLLTFDDVPTEDSQNPARSGGIYSMFLDALATVERWLAGKQDELTWDATPTEDSMNPVRSGGIYAAFMDALATVQSWLATKQNTLTFDQTPTEDSGNPVTSDGIFDALATKQDSLTIDTDPSPSSMNPVSSGGVYNAAQALQPAGDYAAAAPGDPAAIRTASIPFGKVDATSTSTVFTATVPGITSLYDGVACYLMNGVVTSAANFTLNINGLGALPVYSTLAAASRSTTIFNVNYTMLFVYNSRRVEGGCWDVFYGYDSNTNTLAYQVRTNSSSLPASDKFYRYRLLFTSADGTKWVPANTSSSTNATASRAVNQRPIDPFGEIVYYATTAAIEADAVVTAAQIWQQYTLTFGYSFNRTGAALVLPYPKPIYIKATPQTDGSAIIDPDTPYVTALPTTDDGKIYIFLGRTYSATAIELLMKHPVYHYKNGAIRQWTGPV